MRIPGLLFHIQFLGALVDYRFCHSLEMSNFQLADIRPWLPSKTVAEIYRRTHGSVVSRQLLNASLIDTQPSQILHAFVQHIGLPGNTMLLKGRAIAAAILKWSLHGFGDNGSHVCINFRSIHIMQTILLEWLMPASARHIKSHEIIWQLSSSLAAITGLHDLWRKARVRKHLRVILRAFHPNIQDAILNQHSESTDWKRFLTQIFRSIWEHNKINHECMNYFMWSIHSRTWYTGITETSRSFLGSKFLPGAVARYREHMSNTFKFNNNRNENRYKAWKQSFPCELGFLPFCWSSKAKTATFERNVITQLQAPLQDRVKVRGFRPSRYRPWPHHRKRLSFEQEKSLNLSVCHSHEQKHKLAGVPVGISDFKELRRWRKREYRESQKKVEKKCTMFIGQVGLPCILPKCSQDSSTNLSGTHASQGPSCLVFGVNPANFLALMLQECRRKPSDSLAPHHSYVFALSKYALIALAHACTLLLKLAFLHFLTLSDARVNGRASS